MTTGCCIPDWGCVETETLLDCILAGGWDTGLPCSHPLNPCIEVPPPAEPDGCYGRLTWFGDPAKRHWGLDLCEQTVCAPTFIIDEEIRFEPVSTYKSRAQPVGGFQDPCQICEGFITLHITHIEGMAVAIAEPLMCTGRGSSTDHLVYARGDVFIEQESDFLLIEKGEAGIVFATEAPFFIEANYNAQGYVCEPPYE